MLLVIRKTRLGIFLFIQIMSWSRAVWKEGSKTVEGVVPSVWICSEFVKWPRKNERTAFKERAEPRGDWSIFQLVKVKFISGKYHLMVLVWFCDIFIPTSVSVCSYVYEVNMKFTV